MPSVLLSVWPRGVNPVSCKNPLVECLHHVALLTSEPAYPASTPNQMSLSTQRGPFS